MSIDTWEKEFLHNRLPQNGEEAVCHTVQFWIGMLPANLARHGVGEEAAAHCAAYQSCNRSGYGCICCSFVYTVLAMGCPECPLNFGYVNPVPDDPDGEGCTQTHAYLAWTKENDREPGILLMLDVLEDMRNGLWPLHLKESESGYSSSANQGL